ncbi:MAG: quinolinate synthase NadA, partial [Spartobacteria bacterium]|nr:quinolinate synthase NadA [Spartobacteria bacterium]
MNPQIQDEIEQLKKEKGAIILAHYYTRPEVQQLADFTGDSLELSRKAKETKARIILFAGVKFMAETAAILSPEKIVLLPEGNPGCSLADSLTAEALRKWRKNFPDAVVVSYVNSTAAVKAESDYCCTSGNAVNVLKAIAAEKTILFCPDAQLGAWAANAAGRKAELWQGGCHVHVAMNRNLLITMANRYPDNEILMHPEALCAVEIPEALKNRTYIYSTSGMIQHAKNSRSSNFLIVT